MRLSRNQHTIASACEVSGRGYWTAQNVRVVMRPAEKDTGILLVRTDLPDCPSCPAHVSHRTDASLRTNLSRGSAMFEMVEHLMAALYAMEVDNCIVEINSLELPGLDGSCRPYCDALASAGLVIQAAQRQRLVIEQMITLRDGDSWITASPVANGISHFGYQLAFDHPCEIATQSHGFSLSPHRFMRDIASARTFVTKQQADALHAQGVGKHVTYQDLLVFGEEGPIDNALRFSNECARHKSLDLVGDLALAGVELVGKFVSHRGGHQLNGKLATALHQIAVQMPAANQSRVLNQPRRAA